MTIEIMPSGGTGSPQRTPAVPGVTNGPSPKAAMGSTGKAAESAPTSTEGADSLKARFLAGQTVDKTPGKLVESIPALGTPGTLPGGGCAPGGLNVEAVPAGYPRDAPSRHPNVGSSSVNKSANLAKIRGK